MKLYLPIFFFFHLISAIQSEVLDLVLYASEKGPVKQKLKQEHI